MPSFSLPFDFKGWTFQLPAGFSLEQFKLPLSRDNAVGVAISASAIAVTTMCGVFSYHYFLCQTRSGEARIRWSWMPILGDALQFGKRPVEYVLDAARDVHDILGVLLAGERIFFVKDLDSYGSMIKADKKKVR